MGDVVVKNLGEMESIFDGFLVRARASLGGSSFGMQVIEMQPGSDAYPEHDHRAGRPDDGQEEIHTPLSGSAILVADGEERTLGPGDFARLGPDVTRRFRPGPEGARLLCLGGTPGSAYAAPEFTELGGPVPQPPSQ